MDEEWKPEDIDSSLDQLIERYSTGKNEFSLCKDLNMKLKEGMFTKAIHQLNEGNDPNKLLQGQLPFVDAVKWSLDFARQIEPKYPVFSRKSRPMVSLGEIADLYLEKWKNLCQSMNI